MSSTRKSRKELLTALEAALRDVSGMGVLHSQVIAERLGINSTDLECLGVIMRGPATAGALAEATGLTTGAITGVIDRLERAGFARRAEDPNDRRKVLVSHMPALFEKAGPLFDPMRRASMAVLSRYSEDELVLILDFLKRSHDSAVEVVAALRKTSRARTAKRAK
jgi:DNA-binding MarR family transcriptional regulator